MAKQGFTASVCVSYLGRRPCGHYKYLLSTVTPIIRHAEMVVKI